MTLHELDRFFPYFLFSYGLLAVAMGEVPWSQLKTFEKFPDLCQRLGQQFPWGWVCLIIGGGWILQNIWFVSLN